MGPPRGVRTDLAGAAAADRHLADPSCGGEVSTAAAAAPLGLDVSATPGIPFSRLFVVELRKAVDTRAGRWLVGITVGLALLAEAIFLIVAATKNLDSAYGDFVA